MKITRKDVVLQAQLVQAVSLVFQPELPPRNPSPCEAFCYRLPKGATRTECLQNCEATAATAAIAEKLKIVLFESFIDVIWAGGHIDPRPLEDAVRKQFNNGRL